MAKKKDSPEKGMHGRGNENVLRTYLEAVREAKKAGFDDWEADSIAEGITRRKHGRMPKEGGYK